ncbi:hypothetical protein [Pseudomonas aeruginosa]|uniref:hypothetical protein n=1 Tax=Pseudomonas aeruginosa TaxID=287 RepID=UPI001969945F|nr:hypothetical protein [Pseudomonas aeruginosa]MCS7968408.1 hypothetical protein [Pseudomonas aeruginosa]MCS8136906.1 hypothetical protein [Pseudomonas aeruginosa]MCS8179089.1 hypothetical protein [Pseudomonas aeruginosa]MCS8191324.1 hypothetical protein [Pseudomonas aeruginosa]MCT0921006.1 hypothetical protein [Pseudomonas aeruginosa]
MSQHIIVIDTYEDLLSRDAFEPSLAFHPKAPRHFGTIIAPYRFLERVECGIASCRQPHLSGYLISTSDSKETAIGIDCGKTFFGASFSRERKRVDAAVARKRRIETVTRMIERMAEILPVVEGIHRQYRELVDLKLRLQGAIDTDVMSTLKERARRDNPVIERRVPMTEAEAEIYFETNTRRPGDGWPTKAEFLANLEGLEFFKDGAKVLLLTNLVVPISDLSKTKADEVSLMKPRLLAATAKWVGEVPLHLAKAQRVVASGQAFFISP